MTKDDFLPKVFCDFLRSSVRKHFGFRTELTENAEKNPSFALRALRETSTGKLFFISHGANREHREKPLFTLRARANLHMIDKFFNLVLKKLAAA